GTFLTADLRDMPRNGVVAVLVVGKGGIESYLSSSDQRELTRELSRRGCETRVIPVQAVPGHESIQMLQGVIGVLATGWLSQSWMAVLNGLSVPAVIVGDSCTDKPSP